MRYRTLGTALSLLLGSGVALAQSNYPAQPSTKTTTETQSKQATPPSSSAQPRTSTGATRTKTTEKAHGAATAQNVQNVDLFFKTDSADLNEAATGDLQKLADWARCDKNNAIILEGYADPRGTKDHNLKLSGERAAAVRQKLIDMGVPSQRIVISVFGENGKKRDTLSEDRRVTARASEAPVMPEDLSG